MVALATCGDGESGSAFPAGSGGSVGECLCLFFRAATQDYERLRWRRLLQPLPQRRKKPKVGSWRALLSLTRAGRPLLWPWPLWRRRRQQLPKEVLSVLHTWWAAGVFFISLLGFNWTGGRCHPAGMLGLWRVKRRASLLLGIPGTVTVACGVSRRSGHPQSWGAGPAQTQGGGPENLEREGKGREARWLLGGPGVRLPLARQGLFWKVIVS